MSDIDRVSSGVYRRQIGDDADKFKYDPQYLAHLRRYDTAVRLLLEYSKLWGQPLRIMNVGCGDCVELRLFTSAYWAKKSDHIQRYVTIDIEEREQPVGDKVAQAIGYEFVQQDLSKNPVLPAIEASIDYIISMEFIEHIHKVPGIAVLVDMYRCLAPGGLLYLATPNADNNKFEATFHRYEYGYEEMLEILREIGFEVSETHGTLINRQKWGKIDPKDLARYDNFGHYWQKVLVANTYPELSDAVGYICHKPL